MSYIRESRGSRYRRGVRKAIDGRGRPAASPPGAWGAERGRDTATLEARVAPCEPPHAAGGI